VEPRLQTSRAPIEISVTPTRSLCRDLHISSDRPCPSDSSATPRCSSSRPADLPPESSSSRPVDPPPESPSSHPAPLRPANYASSGATGGVPSPPGRHRLLPCGRRRPLSARQIAAPPLRRTAPSPSPPPPPRRRTGDHPLLPCSLRHPISAPPTGAASPPVDAVPCPPGRQRLPADGIP
jgi:hypothetical protein